MINFSLPDYYGHPELVFEFLRLQKEKPEIFIENRKIDSIYGFPGHLSWSGGREVGCKMDPMNVYRLINDYRHRHPDIKIRHTCTNSLIDQYEIYNKASNNFIQYCEREGDSIIANSDILIEYIKDKYPKYDIVYSTTRGAFSLEEINRLTEDPKHTVVIHYNDNHNFPLFSALKHPEQVELIAADICKSNCPYRQIHYESISEIQQGVPSRVGHEFRCVWDTSENFYDVIQLPHAITNQDIDFYYKEFGINHYKMAGRNERIPLVIEAFLYYLIKPEFHNRIRQDLLLKFMPI